MKIRLSRKSASALSLAFLSAPLWAQTEPKSAPAADEEKPQEIVVTALRRSAALQKVPAAVSAITAEQLDRAGIKDMSDVSTRTPSFVIGQQGPASPDMSIRGIGSTDRDAGSDRSVVVFLDEVYAGRAGGIPPDLFDLERVEVLRGPQGTLYGKNAVGGAINLISRKPTQATTASGEFTVGSDSLREIKGAFGGGLSETVAGRLAFSNKSRGPLYENKFLNAGTDDYHLNAMRGQLRWNPADEWDILLSADYSKDKVNGISTYVSPKTDALLAIGFDPGSGRFVSYNNVLGFMDREIGGVHLRVEREFNAGTLTWLTGMRTIDLAETRDLAGVPLRPISAGIRGFESTQIMTEKSTSFSQELRFTSRRRGPWSYITGLYYQSEETDRVEERKRQLNTAISRPVFTQGADTTSYAAFGQVTWQATDALGFTVGGRYTRDERDFALKVTNPFGLASLSPATQLFDITANKAWSAFTPKATVDLALSPDVLAYATIGRGYKSGGFQGLAATAAAARTPFNPEYATSQELGLKSRWLDRRLTLNGSVFTTDFTDLQFRQRILTIPNDQASAIVVVANAGTARIKGAEVETVWAPSKWQSYTLGYSYLDTLITSFNATPGVTDVNGLQLARSPRNTFNAAVDLSTPVGAYVLGGRVDYRYRSSFWFEPSIDRALFEPGYALIDARVSLAQADKKWSVELWGRNLTDRSYRTFAQAIGFATAGVSAATSRTGDPRMVGMTMRWSL